MDARRRLTTSITLDSDTRIAAVPQTVWQAAETTGDYTLVACFVAPGFEFEDFAMMSDHPEAQATLPEEGRRLI